MKPPPFEYTAPATIDEALQLVGQHGLDGKLLAGGQSLIPLLNFRLANPTILIDLNRLSELDFIRETPAGGLRIGAMTRQVSLEKEPIVGSRAPLLQGAMPFLAHPQIRNRGTLGGTLAHADPSAELPAVTLALGARLCLRCVEGERWVDASDFYVGLLSTALEDNEILTEVELPPDPPRSGWSFQEVARRHGDYAQAGVACRLTIDQTGVCTDARLAYLSLGDGPVLATAATTDLVGTRLDNESIEAVAQRAAATEIDPSNDIHASADFKRHLCRILTRRSLVEARDRALSRSAA